MSAMQGECTQETLNQDSSVCVGDGTTCVECGKVFTHPFYFSTHISSHTSEKGFVVIGQCALCGLVFSDADVFAAHLNSSQLKLEKQVAPPQEENVARKSGSNVKSKVTSQVASVVKKKSTEIKLEIIDQEDIKVENHSPQSSEVKAGGKNVTDSNDEARGKRKRKAPQRYEIDSGPQLATSRVAADPEVEAYLLSLKQMGLTVDPDAFSSGAKRRRKTSEGSGGKGRGRKEFLLIEDLVSDVLFQQKQSPKYEYLDSDDSFDEEPEILPESGKMTRGQRLQQRHERLSQGKGSSADKKSDIVKLEVTSDPENNEPRKETSSAVDVDTQNKETAPQPKPNATVTQLKSNATVAQPKPNATVTQPKSDATTTAAKRVQPTSAPSQVIKKEKPSIAAPYFAGRVPQLSHPRGRGRGALAQPNIGKLNAVRANHAPTFAGRNNQYRAFSMPNTSNSNIYQPRSAVASNSGPRPLRFPQGQVRERKDAGKLPSMLMNVQKSSSLEDLKKNSRDNVEMMLQSVGMIAVTSSAMGQGKIFGSEKGDQYPPVNKMEAANIRQASHPYGGFMNKPFSSQKSLPSQQSGAYRGQARFGSGPRGRLPAHPQPYRSNLAVQLSHGQGFGVGSQRGRGQQFSSSLRGSMRGRGSNPTAKGGLVSTNSMMRGSARGRGLNSPARGSLAPATSTMRGSVRGRGSNPSTRGKVMSATNSACPTAPGRGGTGSVSKQTKPVQAAGDVIVIVDDDDVQEISAGPSGVLPAGSGRAGSSKSPKSSTARGSKVEVAILDVDMDSLNSDIKIIEDKTKELSSPTGSADLQDNASIEQPPHDDVGDNDVNDDGVEGKHRSKEKSNDSLKVESKPLQAEADIQPTSGNDKIVDDADSLPGEEFDGWKVCLAEDSDSNDDTPSPQVSTVKASVSKDLHVSPAGSPEPRYSSPQKSEPALEDLTQKTSPHHPGSDVSQKVEHNDSQPQNVEHIDSQPQEDVECRAASATAELKVESESQNDADNNVASEMTCHEKQDICYDDIKSVTVSDQGLVPDGSNENQTVEVKSESPGPGASSLLEGVSQAGFEDILEEFKQENSSLSVSHTEDRAEGYTEDAHQSMQTALNADITTTPTLSANNSNTEDRPFILDSNDDSSVAFTPDDAVLSDKETGYIEASTGPADCQTAIEENCLTKTDFETGSTITLPESGILVTDIVPALSCSHTSNGSSSDQAEEDSIAPPSDSDRSLVNDRAHSHVSNCKSDSEPDVGSISLPAGSSNEVNPENNVDSASKTFSSHPPASHSFPAAAADCLRDDSNLLDIFTEIEKTCKEMEQTLDSEADKKSLVLTEKVDVSRAVSDLSEESGGVDKEEPDFNGVMKVADRSNGVAFSESRSDVGVKESRSGDCRYSDMIYEKEVIDNGNVPSIGEEHNNSKLVEKDATGDDCGM